MMTTFWDILSILIILFLVWIWWYKRCLADLREKGYDPVWFSRYSWFVLRPALRRYRKSLAEKEKIEKNDKFNF